MAPFKLKFRMGSSRSTSQETDPDPQVNEALLGTQQDQHPQQLVCASSSTIDSAGGSSPGSMGNNASERKLLLPNKGASGSNSLRLGYVTQNRTPCINESLSDAEPLPTTPPPSYEHVLEENTRLSLCLDSATPNHNSRRSSANSSRHSANLSGALDHLSNSGVGSICTDPKCQQNYANSSSANDHSGSPLNHNNNNNDDDGGEHIIEGVTELAVISDTEFDIEIDDESPTGVNEFLLESEMASATNTDDERYMVNNGQCNSSHCAQCSEDAVCGTGAIGGGEMGNPQVASFGEEPSTSNDGSRSFYDPLLNSGNFDNCSEDGSSGRGETCNEKPCTEACCASVSGSSRSRASLLQQSCASSLLTPELMSNKTSKEIYKDLAKQWGITCKMSESCRCMECQSHYFDCDYDENEHQKTDGGLGAGTPMFISEVMHGSGCNIL